MLDMSFVENIKYEITVDITHFIKQHWNVGVSIIFGGFQNLPSNTSIAGFMIAISSHILAFDSWAVHMNTSF